MSNFLCFVSTKALENKTIYGATLKKMQSIDSLSSELGFETAYCYAIMTNINYEKIGAAKIECPEVYHETEKMYNSIYELSGEILKSGGKAALFLTYAGQNSFEDIWEMKILPRKNFKAKNLEFDFGILYVIE